MAAIANRIVIGDDQSNPIFEFTNDEIISVNSDTSVSLVGEELYIDQFSAQVDYYVWIPYVFKPTDYSGFMSSDSKILCSRMNYDIRQLPYGTKIVYYAGGNIAGTFYVKTVERVAREFYKISAVSAIGIIDKQYHVGGVYQGAYFKDVVEEILGNDFDYFVDGDVAIQTVYGWLPYATKRENLYQLLLAYGAEIVLGNNGSLFFSFPSDDETTAQPIPIDRVFDGGKVIYDEPASIVNVNEHSYHYDANIAESVLFDNSADSSVDHSTVIFNEPIYPSSIYVASGSITIHESAANYAVISGSGILRGKPYVHNIRLISQTNENAQVEKVVSVQDATLISFVNADNVLARLSEYYFNSIRVEQDIVAQTEKPGQLYTTQNAYGELITGYIVKMTKTVSSFARAACRFLLNYIPVGSGSSYYNRVFVPLDPGDSYTWTIPSYVFEKDVPTFRVVLIGRGENGADGEDGETPTDTPDRMVRGANGGAGGRGGNGGKILTVTINATGLTQITVANSGNNSVLTSSRHNFSSANGASNDFGYFDPFVQTAYAVRGKDGVHGGKGGDGDYYTHSRAQESTATDGESVSHGNVTYSGGQHAERNVINGRQVWPNSQYSGNLTLYTAGSGGGGAAVGHNGGNAFASNNSPSEDWFKWGMGGNGADASNADATADVYGAGGNGGHGGGGGGGGACYESWNHVYSSVIATGNKGSGKGGKGGKGGTGKYGCAIIYY